MTNRELLKDYGFEPDKTVATMTIEQLYKLMTLANIANVTTIKTKL